MSSAPTVKLERKRSGPNFDFDKALETEDWALAQRGLSDPDFDPRYLFFTNISGGTKLYQALLKGGPFEVISKILEKSEGLTSRIMGDPNPRRLAAVQLLDGGTCLHVAIAKFTLSAYRACFQRCYFKVQRVVMYDSAVSPDSKTLIGFHPHGALSCGWTLANASSLLGSPTTNMQWLVAPLLFRIPLIADVLTWNSVQSVVPRNFKKVMSKGQNISIIPGGFHSAAVFKSGRYRCFVLKRKGFVKYALQYGYALRPAFCFGEESTYLTLNLLERFRLKYLAGNNVPPVLFLGKYGVLPFDNHEMTVVVGSSIQCPFVENPTKEDVEKYHSLYVEGLRRVFDENKKEYATEDATLELM